MSDLSIHAIMATSFGKGLASLGGVLGKAAAHAAAHKIDERVLLDARLYPNMFALTRQVQICADMAKGAAARLAGAEVPRFEDSETSFADLQARLARTAAFVAGHAAEHYAGAADRLVTIPAGQRSYVFKGSNYLLQFALPNFWFHHTTTYAILRHNGVELGKGDFLGALDLEG